MVVVCVVTEHAGEVDGVGGDDDAVSQAVVFYVVEVGGVFGVEVDGLNSWREGAHGVGVFNDGFNGFTDFGRRGWSRMV